MFLHQRPCGMDEITAGPSCASTPVTACAIRRVSRQQHDHLSAQIRVRVPETRLDRAYFDARGSSRLHRGSTAWVSRMGIRCQRISQVIPKRACGGWWSEGWTPGFAFQIFPVQHRRNGCRSLVTKVTLEERGSMTPLNGRHTVVAQSALVAHLTRLVPEQNSSRPNHTRQLTWHVCNGNCHHVVDRLPFSSETGTLP